MSFDDRNVLKYDIPTSFELNKNWERKIEGKGIRKKETSKIGTDHRREGSKKRKNKEVTKKKEIILQKERFTRIIVGLYSPFLFEKLPNRTINSLPFMEPEDSRWQELTTGPYPKSADSSVCAANLLRISASLIWYFWIVEIIVLITQFSPLFSKYDVCIACLVVCDSRTLHGTALHTPQLEILVATTPHII